MDVGPNRVHAKRAHRQPVTDENATMPQEAAAAGAQTERTRRLVADFFEARISGDRARLIELLADDVCWQVPACFADRAPPTGRDAIATQLAGRGAGVYDPATFEITPRCIIADGDTAAARHRLTAMTLAGVPYDNEYCWVFTCRDGRIARLEEYTDTLTLARAWGLVHAA
jgi:hypothetical protein